MARKVWREMRGDANWPQPRPATSVRYREGLVQVQMADVSANGCRTGQPDLRVHVRSVHVHLAAVAVDDVADGADAVFEYTVR